MTRDTNINSPRRIVVLDANTLGPSITIRPPDFPHTWTNFPKSEDQTVTERAKNANILVTNKVPIDRKTLEQTKKLELIAVAATGTNIVDLEACQKRGIAVCNIRGYAAQTVAEHTVAAILALRRGFFQYREQVQQGAWQEAGQFCFFNEPVFNLTGSRLGILGTGSLATATGSLAKKLGLKVWHHSISGRSDYESGDLVDADTLFSQSDIVSVHCPLTEASNNFVDQTRLRQMKDTALLVNTARGEIVNLDHLHKAIQQKQIAGAAIDVAPVEPPPLNATIMKLASFPNVLVTPHIAWSSVEARQTLVDQLIDNMNNFVAGRPTNLVTTS